MKISQLDEFTGTPGASDYLATDNGSNTSKVSAEKLFEGARTMWYGTSSTSASTSSKTATCEGFTLETGVTIAVKFTYGNTYAGQITLNVNSTGAKNVYDYGQFYDGYSRCGWDANQTMIFVYDGTRWCLTNGALILGSELDALETALGI